jgi:hypothetical protein
MQDGAPIRAAGAAFRLLRGLLPADTPGNLPGKVWSLPALQRRGALRLRVPSPDIEALQ